MTAFEVYNLFLCLFVFIGFTAVFGVMLYMLIKNALKLIKHGIEDNKIQTEYLKTTKSKSGKVVDTIASIFMCAVVFVVFGFSVLIGLMPDKVKGDIPTIRVVNSGSMASKYEENKYLFKNNLNDQIQTFDLILTYKLPKEEDLKLYDIVVYEVDGILILHRIVGIEEANKDHPNERWFLLQGDAVASPDRFPVKYEQMKSIYRGERMPFVGSFIAFMQSPAGWLCIILVIVAVIITPILEKKILKEIKSRLLTIGFIDESGNVISSVLTQNEQLEPITEEEIAITNDKFSHLKGKKNDRSFAEKLNVLPYEDTCRYIDLTNFVDELGAFKSGSSDKAKIYKYKNKTAIKIVVKGKTVNLYLALNPQDYNETKYKFVDVSNVKKYSSTPMRIKITSSRQLKYAKELVNDIISGFNKGE